MTDIKTRWIPVSERMPRDESRVLFIAPGWIEPSMGWWSEGEQIWLDCGTDSQNHIEHPAGLVTHWMPLPAPPAARR